ncbi:dihydrofolate reductase [Microbacteriaceae bacterium VKM Ac-2855]|nr:dihydrofolate reductase [Microbacteriaceae bacterium VKM Ac-2855]
MSTQYYVAGSLDGFIADSAGGIDWLLAFGFEAYEEHYNSFLAGVGAIVMGADTYDSIFGDDGTEAWPYGETPCWVLSHHELPAAPGAVLHVVEGDVAAVHEAATAAAGSAHVWLVGGGNVVAQFADAGLLDEIWLTVMPIALGSGRPLLPLNDISPVLELLAVTPFTGGAVELRYAVPRP